MRREGKPGPFIPSEVPAQTGLARVTTPTPARRRRRATRAVDAQAKRPRSGDDVYSRAETLVPARERMHAGDNACARATTGGMLEGCFFTNTTLLRRRLRPGDNACVRATTYACARATTSAPVQRLVPRGRGVFSPTPQNSMLGRRRLRLGDNACVQATTYACARATMSAPVRRQVPRGRGVFSQTPQTSTSGDDVYVRATTSALGRQRLHPCGDGCRVGGVFFHKHPKLQHSGDDVCVRATTSASKRQRLHTGDDVWILLS